MKLLRIQQKSLLEWAAEGLRLDEINQRAAKCDPPFSVEWNQLKHARRSLGVNLKHDRALAVANAATKRLPAQKLQGRICVEIHLTPKIHAEVEAVLAKEDHEKDLSRLIDDLLFDWLLWRHI